MCQIKSWYDHMKHVLDIQLEEKDGKKEIYRVSILKLQLQEKKTRTRLITALVPILSPSNEETVLLLELLKEEKHRKGRHKRYRGTHNTEKTKQMGD